MCLSALLFSDITISQGLLHSDAFECGGLFNYHSVRILLLSLAVKEF